jgi:hypothetical protein
MKAGSRRLTDFSLRPTGFVPTASREHRRSATRLQVAPGTILAVGERLPMSWFKVSDGRVRFRGRITRRSFTEWTGTPEGAAAVDHLARQLRFAILGRTRSAKRRLWRELESAVSTDQVKAILEASPDYYLNAMTELAYAPSLPRVAIELRRMVVIPRTMIAARGRSAINSRLMVSMAYADLNESLRAFLCDRLVWEIDDAIRRARPSVKKPVAAREAWACVSLDDKFVWIDPLWSGKDWLGHVFMYELPERTSRQNRREIENAIAQLQRSLPELSQVQRDGTVRSAIAAMNPARA